MQQDKDSETTDQNEPSPAPGPTDQGGKGGMATREVAPEIAKPAPSD
jgi:hypothetical protein